jgi:hypothetical protein
MATFYVDSAASGDDGGSNWTNAFPDLATAFADAGTVAGSDLLVDDGHSFTPDAIITYSSKGTLAAPVNVYVVDKADDSYAGKSGTGSNAAIEDNTAGLHTIYTDGFANVYGVHFKSGGNIIGGATNDNETWQFIDCVLEVAYNNAAAELFEPEAGQCWKLFNTDIKFAHTGGSIVMAAGAVFEWFGGTLLTTDTAQLVEEHFNLGGIFRARGVDLSIMNGGAIFNGFGFGTNEAGFYGEIVGCKLNATPPALVTDTPAVDGVYLAMIGCGSAGVPQTHIHTSQGDVTQETSVVRTATYDGSNKYSFEMISNVNADFHTPLRFKLAEIWCAADPTLTVECTHDAQGSEAGGNFGDDEFWIEVEHPNDTVAAYRNWDRTSRMATLGSSTIRDAGTSGDWTAGKTDFDKCEEVINSSAGIHTIWACLGVASKTVYVCPKIDVS